MTDARRDRIKHLAWQSKAKSARKDVEASLASCVGQDVHFEFIDEELTQHFGNRFWDAVRAVQEVSVSGFDECMNMLCESGWPKGFVIYFHSKTRESGAIRIALVELLKSAGCLQKKLGPDFLFMDPEGAFGFCYEEGESYHACRAWRLTDQHR